MKSRKEIKELASELGEYNINGFINGFTVCRDEMAEAIRNTPNDADLGRKLRSLFLEKKIL